MAEYSSTGLSLFRFFLFHYHSREISEREEAERHFLENGALLLEEMITSFNGRSNSIRSFSKKELKRATNNYHQHGLLHEDSAYKLYKGTYEDRPISVKKFRENTPQKYIGWSINEVAVASKMNCHKNVLKLLGCCLETQVPTLVFEFAVGGCLSDHIYEKDLSPSEKNPILSWESRLRIATEIADAVAYLHNGTSKPIIHRDIKSTNIFLDQHYVAKPFDFELSILIPLGQTHVEADVAGTHVFIAPEILHTSRYTEKSDVYSFGMVLFEILKGKRASDLLKKFYNVQASDKIEKNKRLYLEANIMKGNTKQLMECAELTVTNPEERPSMIETAKELRRIDMFSHDSL